MPKMTIFGENTENGHFDVLLYKYQGFADVTNMHDFEKVHLFSQSGKSQVIATLSEQVQTVLLLAIGRPPADLQQSSGPYRAFLQGPFGRCHPFSPRCGEKACHALSLQGTDR